jgi:hypothetical protein
MMMHGTMNVKNGTKFKYCCPPNFTHKDFVNNIKKCLFKNYLKLSGIVSNCLTTPDVDRKMTEYSDTSIGGTIL